jgi:hypothetical protein
MSNFSFIPNHWANIAQTPKEAEQHVYGAPFYAAMLCRKSLEEWVHWMIIDVLYCMKFSCLLITNKNEHDR